MEDLLEAKNQWVAEKKQSGVEGVYKAQAIALPLPPPLRDALRVPRAPRALIGLIDRSRAEEPEQFDVTARVFELEKLGCSAIMVMVDSHRHSGRYEDVLAAAQATQLPIICSDYVIDRLQVTMARAHGAAAVVLSASLLPERVLRSLFKAAVDLQLDVVFDVSTAKQVESAAGLRVGHGHLGVPRVFAADILRCRDTERERLVQRVSPGLGDDYVAIVSTLCNPDLDAERSEALGFDVLVVDGTTLSGDELASQIEAQAGSYE